jgi:cytochrome b subunit of formate dehydrogenase
MIKDARNFVDNTKNVVGEAKKEFRETKASVDHFVRKWVVIILCLLIINLILSGIILFFVLKNKFNKPYSFN